MSADLRLAPRLEPGDLVRLVSPASFPQRADVEGYEKILAAWGLRCDRGAHVLDQHGYMAGTDQDRLDDLNEAYRNPEVRAIITTRGGAGAYRICDDIDFAAVEADPKPMVGFSDITSLQLSLLTRCRIGSVHGCLYGDTAIATAKHLLMTTHPIVLKSDKGTVSGHIEFPGTATGKLIGGNLQMVATSVGVRMPPLEGAILFLEYHRAGLGTIDRYLTQLLRSGLLDKIAGVVLGSFEAAKDHVDRGWTAVDVLGDRLEKLSVPVLGGIRAGHDLTDPSGDSDQCSLPIGSMASMDVGNGVLVVEPVVS